MVVERISREQEPEKKQASDQINQWFSQNIENSVCGLKSCVSICLAKKWAQSPFPPSTETSKFKPIELLFFWVCCLAIV